jgi:1,4-dihydroxy-2-naphthoate octaprenyltransferase
MFLPAEVLLAGALLVGVFPLGGLLVAEKEVVPVVSGFLEKREKIPLGSVTLGEEKVLLSFGALLVIWCSGSLSSSLDWTGGHRQSYFWSLPMCWCAGTTMKICEYKCNRCKNGIGMDERV